MDMEPTSWEEIEDAPEIPKNFEGKIVSTKEYCQKDYEPQISFIPVLMQTTLKGEEKCKWYISHVTASCLQSTGYRGTSLMPIEAKKDIYFYDYETTKRYAQWFFDKKGKIIYKIGNQHQVHFLLCFFCDDENWAPFHHDFVNHHEPNIHLLKLSNFSVSDITMKLLGREEFETSEECYTKGEIAFMRALVALTLAFRPEFQTKYYYDIFVKNQIDEFNKVTDYGLSFDSFIVKAEYNQFNNLSLRRSSYLFPLICRYFFALNNLEGQFVRNVIKKFQTVSFFNIIYRFLRSEDKRLVHFDETILKEVKMYVTQLQKLAALLGDRLPYAELLTMKFRASAEIWKNLAGVAYLYTIEKYSKCKSVNDVKVLKKLKTLIPNLEETLRTTTNEKENEIYKQFDEMEQVHKYMKNIPWDDYELETKYADYLSDCFVDDFFFY